jgi:hypothetical protein
MEEDGPIVFKHVVQARVFDDDLWSSRSDSD